METLIAHLGIKHGRVAELARSVQGKLSIGRGFDNDLVLTDLHVAPKQVKCYQDSGQWYIAVLDITNPVLLNGKPIHLEPTPINSGDTITIGRTNISLFSENHSVERTKKLALSSWLYRAPKGYTVPFLLLLFVCCFDAFASYLQDSTNLEWKEQASAALLLGFCIILWSGLWSLAGRLFRHQQSFRSQLISTSIVCLMLSVITPITPYLEYFTNSLSVREIADYSIAFFSLTILFRLNLFFSTNIKNTLAVSVIFSGAIIALTYCTSNFLNEDKFSYTPEFSTVLKPPLANIRDSVSVNTYFHDLESMMESLSNCHDCGG